MGEQQATSNQLVSQFPAAVFADATSQLPLGGVRIPEPAIAASPLSPTPVQGPTKSATMLRVALAGTIIAGLVLGTASLSYGQSTGASDAPERPRLASEPLVPSPIEDSAAEQDAVEAELATEDLAEAITEAVAGIEPDELADPGELLDDVAEGVDVEVSQPVDVQPGVVHLTFDDGPHPEYTPAILDVLARHDAKATFFVLGSLVEAHPAIFQRIVDEGHTVANHTWAHADLTEVTQAEFNESIRRTEAALGSHATPCLRPPFGSFNADVRRWAGEFGLELVLWGTDTLDWQKPGASVIADRIVAGADRNGSILLHDGGGNRTQTVEGLDEALTELSGRGLSYEPICRP